jgi:hypothetical protein
VFQLDQTAFGAQNQFQRGFQAIRIWLLPLDKVYEILLTKVKNTG